MRTYGTGNKRPRSTEPFRAILVNSAGGLGTPGLGKTIAAAAKQPQGGSAVKDAVIDVAKVPLQVRPSNAVGRATRKPLRVPLQKKAVPPPSPVAPASPASFLADGYPSETLKNRLVTSLFHRQAHGAFPTAAGFHQKQQLQLQRAASAAASSLQRRLLQPSPPPPPPPLDARSLLRPWRPFTRSLDGLTADMRILLEKVQPALKRVILLGFTRRGCGGGGGGGDCLVSYSFDEVEQGFSAAGAGNGLGRAENNDREEEGGMFDSIGPTAVRFELQLWSVVPSWRSLSLSPGLSSSSSPSSSPGSSSSPPPFGVDLVTTFPLFHETAWKDWAKEAKGDDADGDGDADDEPLLLGEFSSFEPSQVKIVVMETEEGALFVQGSLVGAGGGSASGGASGSGHHSNARLPRTCHLTVVPPFASTPALASLVRLRGMQKARLAFAEKREVARALLEDEGEREDEGEGGGKSTKSSALRLLTQFAPLPVRPRSGNGASGGMTFAGGGGERGGDNTFGGSIVRCFHTSFSLAYPYPAQSALSLVPLGDGGATVAGQRCSQYRLIINTGEGLRCLTLALHAVGAVGTRPESTTANDNGTNTAVEEARPKWWRDLLPKQSTRSSSDKAKTSAFSFPFAASRRFPMSWSTTGTGRRADDNDETAARVSNTPAGGGLSSFLGFAPSRGTRESPQQVQALQNALDMLAASLHRQRQPQQGRRGHWLGGESDQDDGNSLSSTGDVSVASAFELEAEPLLSRLLSGRRVLNYDLRFCCLLDAAYASACGAGIKARAGAKLQGEKEKKEAKDAAMSSSDEKEETEAEAVDDEDAEGRRLDNGGRNKPSAAFDIGPGSSTASGLGCIAVFSLVVDHEVPLSIAVNTASAASSSYLASAAAAASASASAPTIASATRGEREVEQEGKKPATEDAFAFREELDQPSAAPTSIALSITSTSASTSRGTSTGDGWDNVLADAPQTALANTATTAAPSAPATIAVDPPKRPAAAAVYRYGGGRTSLPPSRPTAAVTAKTKPPQQKQQQPKAFAPPSSSVVRSLFVCSLDVASGQVRVLESGRLPPAFQPAFDDHADKHHKQRRGGSRLSDALFTAANSAVGRSALVTAKPLARGASSTSSVSLASVFAGQHRSALFVYGQARPGSVCVAQTIESLSRMACSATLSRLLPTTAMGISSRVDGSNDFGVRQLDNLNLTNAHAGANTNANATAGNNTRAASNAGEADSDDEDDVDDADGNGGVDSTRGNGRAGLQRAGRDHHDRVVVVGARSLKKLTHPIYPLALVA